VAGAGANGENYNNCKTGWGADGVGKGKKREMVKVKEPRLDWGKRGGWEKKRKSQDKKTRWWGKWKKRGTDKGRKLAIKKEGRVGGGGATNTGEATGQCGIRLT